MICLDTNIVIGAINRRVPNVRQRLENALVERAPIGVPVIALYEILYGIKKSARQQANAAALATFLTLDLALWPFEVEDAEQAGDIRAVLERAGTPIGPYDVLIAAQARRRGAVLVTGNAGEFARVPGLKIEDWGAS
jgi:tRNA(fMet)-specific endonuclease VapC